MEMTHPGLPYAWAFALWMFMAGLFLWVMIAPSVALTRGRSFSLKKTPVLGTLVHYVTVKPWVLFSLRIVLVGFMLLIIIAGLFGVPYPERNAATVLTWNIWWAGLVVTIFFAGAAWCGVCPWNTLANWLVKKRLWKRAATDASLNLKVPKSLRTVWPALILFVGLTWIELGVGVTLDPFATAVLALVMVVMATMSLALFERNAFCNYFCPVGRTVGFYAQLGPTELRPVDADICATCTTLECYNGSDDVDPCPTRLVMGRLSQNTYCTNCGNCARSCPHENVAWRLRSPSTEAIQDARPHWDEAWFMVTLLALTGFHGLTMMSFWEAGVITFAKLIGDSGQILLTFTASLSIAIIIPALIYSAIIWLVWRINAGRESFRNLFCRFAFVALPLAFSYHLAHNLNHLLREAGDVWIVVMNPLGIDTLPAGQLEKNLRMMGMLFSQETLYAMQAILLGFGAYIAIRVVQKRSSTLPALGMFHQRMRVLPLVIFVLGVSCYHLWLMLQPMTMRM